MFQSLRGIRHLANRHFTSPVSKEVKWAQTSARPLSTTRPCKETFTVQDEKDFQKRVLQNPDPVVVDFKAVWCGPCKMLTPRLDAAIAGTDGKVHLAIVDIDELSDLAIDSGVEAVPTVVAYKDGQVVDKFVGLIDEDRLGAFVKKLYNKKLN